MDNPMLTHDLSESERRFLVVMMELGFARFEALRIERGELVLDPWPMAVRSVKFGSPDAATSKPLTGDFELKRQTAEFFAYVRMIEAGEIRALEIRRGLPFSMEIE